MRVLLWPFEILARLVAFIFRMTGRFAGVVLALVLVIVGLALTATLVGAIIGIPLMILGLMLMARSVF